MISVEEKQNLVDERKKLIYHFRKKLEEKTKSNKKLFCYCERSYTIKQFGNTHCFNCHKRNRKKYLSMLVKYYIDSGQSVVV